MCALGEVGGGEGCGWNQSLKGSLHHVSEHHTATPYLYCRQFSRDVNQFVSQGVVNMLSAAQWVAHPSGFHQHVIGMDAATLGWDGGGGWIVAQHATGKVQQHQSRGVDRHT